MVAGSRRYRPAADAPVLLVSLPGLTFNPRGRRGWLPEGVVQWGGGARLQPRMQALELNSVDANHRILIIPHLAVAVAPHRPPVCSDCYEHV